VDHVAVDVISKTTSGFESYVRNSTYFWICHVDIFGISELSTKSALTKCDSVNAIRWISLEFFI